MKSNTIVGLTAFLFLDLQTIKAQIFQNRADVINKNGYDYTSRVTDNGIKYITYDRKMNTKASGSYTQTKAIYFTKLDNGTEICYMWKIIEPSSETNSNVASYKSRLVEIAYMQWKDYEKSIIYDIVVKDGFCLVTARGDDKNK